MNILILEDDWQMPEGHGITRWANKMSKSNEHEIKYVFKAYNRGKEIATLLPWADILAFGSTFLYIDKIYALTEVLSKVISKPLTVLIDNDAAESNIIRLLERGAEKYIQGKDWNDGTYVFDEEKADAWAYSLRHLKLFKLNWYEDEKHIPITVLDKRIFKEQLRLDTLTSYMKSRHDEKAKTGRKIKIGEIVANSPQFKNLVQGMIVDEIDMEQNDPRPDRGVWVMGVNEPVKLLNEHPYYEFEIMIKNESDLAEEICKKCSATITKKNILQVIGIFRLSEIGTMYQANLICEILDVEKRGHRSWINNRLATFAKMCEK